VILFVVGCVSFLLAVAFLAGAELAAAGFRRKIGDLEAQSLLLDAERLALDLERSELDRDRAKHAERVARAAVRQVDAARLAYVGRNRKGLLQ
jgi:hypothetical protein